jgi:hypothetical protein
MHFSILGGKKAVGMGMGGGFRKATSTYGNVVHYNNTLKLSICNYFANFFP